MCLDIFQKFYKIKLWLKYFFIFYSSWLPLNSLIFGFIEQNHNRLENFKKIRNISKFSVTTTTDKGLLPAIRAYLR